MTRFQILSRGENGSWREHETVEAHNADEAVKKSYLKKADVGITAMVAVPMRSWRPQQIRVETTQRVILGEPKPESE